MSWKPLILAFILMPILLFVAVFPCGAGHGYCSLFLVFYPMLIFTKLVGDVVHPLVWASLQSLLYEITLGVSMKRGYLKLVTICLLLLHTLAVLLVLRMKE